MKKRLYTVEYYKRDERFGWSNTMKDYVLAKDEEECMKKFKAHHPDKNGSIVDWQRIDY